MAVDILTILAYITITIISLLFYFYTGLSWLHWRVVATGRNIIVAGKPDDLTYQVLLDLSKRGATIILACDNVDKGEKIVKDISSRTANKCITCMDLDLTSLDSINNFFSKYKSSGRKLDVLINLTASSEVLLLSLQLIPLLMQSDEGRIVNVLPQEYNLSSSLVNNKDAISVTGQMAKLLENSTVTANSVEVPVRGRFASKRVICWSAHLIAYLAIAEESAESNGHNFTLLKPTRIPLEKRNEILWEQAQEKLGIKASDYLPVSDFNN